jgi:uncharacterized lipoprotein YajG
MCENVGYMKTILHILFVSAAFAFLAACSTTPPTNGAGGNPTGGTANGNSNGHEFTRGAAPNSNTTMTSSW